MISNLLARTHRTAVTEAMRTGEVLAKISAICGTRAVPDHLRDEIAKRLLVATIPEGGYWRAHTPLEAAEAVLAALAAGELEP